MTQEGAAVSLRPRDSARSRVFLAPLGLWLTLDAGTFEEIELTPQGVRLTLDPATAYTRRALLRVEQPFESGGVGTFSPTGSFEIDRGAYVVPLGDGPVRVNLRSTK